MAIPVDSILEIKVGYRINDQQCYNVLHYKTIGELATADELTTSDWVVANMAGNANGEFPGEFKEVMSSDVVLNELTAQWIYPVRFRVSRAVPNVLGAVVSPCNAQNLQACIGKRGDLGNRHNVGSVHVGGLPNSAIVSGNIGAGFLPDLEALKTFLADEINLEGDVAKVVYPAILNKTKVIVDGKPKYIVSGSTQVTAWDVRDTVRTQRTRTKGKGI